MAAGGKTKQQARRFRDLDIEIGFFEGILEMDPNYLDALELIAQAYTERGLYEKGLQVDIRDRKSVV